MVAHTTAEDRPNRRARARCARRRRLQAAQALHGGEQTRRKGGGEPLEVRRNRRQAGLDLTFARPRRTARAGHHGGVESPGVATTRRAG